MISFKQHLSESLSSAYPYRIQHKDSIQKTFVFHDSSGRPYFVDIYHYSTLELMDVSFYTLDDKGHATAKLTGKSFNPMRIFSTVAAIIRTEIKKGWRIEFSADRDEPSRVKLYDRLAEKLAKEIGGHVDFDYHKNDKKYMIYPWP